HRRVAAQGDCAADPRGGAHRDPDGAVGEARPRGHRALTRAQPGPDRLRCGELTAPRGQGPPNFPRRRALAMAMKSKSEWQYPRDLIGYGLDVPRADWPGGARIAVQFVLNYEEGAENSVLHGDKGSETFLSEIIGAPAYPARHMSMESIYEY